METTEIKTINIADFKDSKHLLYYVDDDFAVIDSLENDKINNHDSIKLDCLLIAVCIEGYIQLDVNLRTYQLQEGDLLLGLPGTFISHTMVSPCHKVQLICFSTRFLQRIFKMERETWNTAIHIHNNPIIENGKSGFSSKVSELYRDLIMTKLNDESHSYHRETMRYLFSALLCEVIGQIEQIEKKSADDSVQESIKRKDHILRRFLKLLSEDHGMHRSVSYFANELCYTPKYLSQTIKQVCGKSPLELINESVIEHIEYRLRRSDRSIKEIAEEFNFPNLSFFCKYVKTHSGMSPVNYRNSAKKG